MIAFRPILAAILSLVGFAALTCTASLHPIGHALAQDTIAAQVAKPTSLPDMALGSADAPVTITEYASMSCSHCAAFGENVFPMLRSKYIDTGKVRFVFREFPLDIKAAAASMLARCIGGDDAEKYLGAVRDAVPAAGPADGADQGHAELVGKQDGMSEQEVETCEKDQAHARQAVCRPAVCL